MSRWLDKLDDLVDRAFIAEQDPDETDLDESSRGLSEAVGDGIEEEESADRESSAGSDESSNIGVRAFARQLEASRGVQRTTCPVHIDEIRSRLHVPRSPTKKSKREPSPTESEQEFDSFVAEAPTTGRVGDSPLPPPIAEHDSMLHTSKESSGRTLSIDPCSASPLLLSQRSHYDDQVKEPVSATSLSRSPHLHEPLQLPKDESDSSSASTPPPFQITGEETRETSVATSNIQRESELQSFVTPPQSPVMNELNEHYPASDERIENSVSWETGAADLSEQSMEVALTQAQGDEREDFQVSLPLPPWDSQESKSFDQSLNCHGVVHVRLYRAQRLPCSVGSTIYACIALPPWKGKIRSERTEAYLGPLESGVCVRWDSLDDAPCSSMVHPWNNDDTPIPTIDVDLMFNFGVLDVKVGSLSLNCKPLMQRPGVWIKKWLPIETAQGTSKSASDNESPLVLLDATFIPSSMDESDVEDDEFELECQDQVNVELLPEMCNDEQGPSKTPSSLSNMSSMSRSSQKSLRPPKKYHFLRVHTFWTPATCSVCSAVLTGWKRGYRCEACNIDCCADCRLQVDLQIPCGSEVAKAAVKKAIQNKFEATKLLDMVAPIDPSLERARTIDKLPTFSNESASLSTVLSPKKDSSVLLGPKMGIGSLRLNIIRACLFSQPMPPESEPNEIFGDDERRALRRGDHYVRISWTGGKDSTRTRTIQNTGRPHFDSDELVFVVPHYGMEYRVEVVDANSDKPIGSTLLTTQGLLQLQRDMMIDEKGIVGYIKERNRALEKRKTVLELRTGLKSGFGADFFYSSSRGKEAMSKSDAKPRAGEITGWIEVDLCLEEDMNRLYGPRPFSCPPPPPDDVQVDMFQIHIARVASLLSDINESFESYMYIISWKDPALTGLSLILFVAVCVRFNLEYIGSLPLFMIVVYMLRLASIRRRGHLKARFCRKEEEARINAEKKVSVKYSVHRPIGRVEVAVYRGKNIRSRDLGLTGSVGCRVYWDPRRYQDGKVEDVVLKYDKAASRTHDIAFTNYQYSQNPIWDEFTQSNESRRLNQLLPDDGMFFEGKKVSSSHPNEANDDTVHFPLLQPIAVVRKTKVADGSQAPEGSVRLDDWKRSRGAVVVQVNFRDVLNKLPGFDDVLGEVSIPMSQLVEKGEIQGWYHILDAGSTETAPGDHTDEQGLHNLPDFSPAKPDGSATLANSTPEYPQLYLKMKWSPPSAEVSDTDREASVVVAEELIRSAVNSRDKMSLIGSSIGAINTVWGLGGNVQLIQNTLGTLLDAIEKIRNAFNFSDPFKSSVLFLFLTVLWLFLAFVPTRALVLVAGLAQYIATFVAAYGSTSKAVNKSQNESHSEEIEGEETEEDKNRSKGPPFVTWLLNSFRSLPTDEDLRRTYFWESCRLGERESQILLTKKRESRLLKLWKAEWHGLLMIKVANSKATEADGRRWEWETSFAIVQGRRLLWWRHGVYAFDSGEAPAGRIFLAGHAGLAGLSPLDLRELHEDEVSRVVTVFGRGMDGQQKLTLMCSTSQLKDELENAILSASTKAD